MTFAIMSESPIAIEPCEAPTASPLADGSAAQSLEDRFVAQINGLIQEADAKESAVILVDVLAWALARMALRIDGPWGAGDIIRRVGGYVCKLQERKLAQEEAKNAKEQGHAPH